MGWKIENTAYISKKDAYTYAIRFFKAFLFLARYRKLILRELISDSLNVMKERLE